VIFVIRIWYRYVEVGKKLTGFSKRADVWRTIIRGNLKRGINSLRFL